MGGARYVAAMIAAARAVSVYGVAAWLCCCAWTAVAQVEPVAADPITRVAEEQAVRLVFTRVMRERARPRTSRAWRPRDYEHDHLPRANLPLR